jgi:ParB family chromosome partitioning protein
MVEENVVREDLSFAEMAQVAITAAEDEAVEESSAEALVGTLYSALHKMKKSYIRSFVQLLGALGEDLKFPKDVARNLGVDVARALKGGQGDIAQLRARLAVVADAEAQNEVLKDFISAAPTPAKGAAKPAKQKFEFHVGQTKITAREGECRILSKANYAAIPQAQLEAAIKAFEQALKDSNPRVTTL